MPARARQGRFTVEQIVNEAERVVRSIEGDKRLDPVASPLAAWIQKATSRTWIKNLLSGTWLGHQLHPMLTDLPIGAWVSASVIDVTAGERGADAARKLVGLGVLCAVPTAAAGASDWADLHGPTQRTGLVHGLLNAAGTVLQIGSWFARLRGARGVGVTLSLAGLGVTLSSAYLGGHLTLIRGVGVNHTAFQGGTRKWTDVAADADVPEGTPLRVMAGKVPVVLVRVADSVRALSATCTHEGGPLDQGTVDDFGCITCPWHGSRFRLADGSVSRGPATAPEPTWDVKVEDERVWVKRSG